MAALAANHRNVILAYKSLCVMSSSAGFITRTFVFIGKNIIFVISCLRQPPFFWQLAPPPCPLGSVSLDSQTSGRISIGRRLYGQARRQCIRPCVFLCRIRTYRLPTNPVPLPPPPKGGTMGAGRWRQFEFMAAAERKPNNRAPPGGKQANRPVGRLKCTPSAAYRRRLPRRGRFALHSASGLISISRHSAAKTSPSGGSTAAGGDRGAFPTGAARLYGFPFRESELQNSSLRRSDTTTL